MGEKLYALGALAVRRKWWFLVGWALVFGAIAASAFAFSGPISDGFRIPGAESQRAIDLLQKEFPGTGGASARVVVVAPQGRTLDDFESLAEQTFDDVAKVPQVIAVTGFADTAVSKDKRIAYGDVRYAVGVDRISDESKAALEHIADKVRDAGLQVEFSGGVITTSEAKSNAELYGMLVALLVLLLTFGSLVSAGMPLIMALLGVGVGLLGIQALSGVIEMTSTAPTLALMLGLAVGIDYTLFLLSRHRHNLVAGMAVEESVALATATAGGAVVFAGLTVVIALSGLSVVGIPFLTTMGLAAAGTVAVVVLIAITLVPAVLAILGTRINAGRLPLPGRRDRNQEGQWGAAWARLVTRKPWITVAAGVAAVGLAALPALDMRLGLPDDSTKSPSTTERRAYDLLTEGFGPGFNGPLTLVIYAPGRSDVGAIATRAVSQLRGVDDVAAVSDPAPNKSGEIALVSVTPASSPSSERTKNLVTTIRAAAKEAQKTRGVTAYVTGTTASNIDVSDKVGKALPVFLSLIVGLALLLLVLVFRSILVPVKAVAGFLLSIAGSLGASVWVFQQGHLGDVLGVDSTSPIVSFLPVLLVGILFGLAMDYEVFLVSRIREEYVHNGDARAAIRQGMTHSSRVVSAAGMIMIAVFAAFIFGGDVVIKSIGFSLSIGVAIDAFLVRMTLVPAVMELLGNRAWWLPRWLDRRLPDLDLEGTKVVARSAAAG